MALCPSAQYGLHSEQNNGSKPYFQRDIFLNTMFFLNTIDNYNILR